MRRRNRRTFAQPLTLFAPADPDLSQETEDRGEVSDLWYLDPQRSLDWYDEALYSPLYDEDDFAERDIWEAYPW